MKANILSRPRLSASHTRKSDAAALRRFRNLYGEWLILSSVCAESVGLPFASHFAGWGEEAGAVRSSVGRVGKSGQRIRILRLDLNDDSLVQQHLHPNDKSYDNRHPDRRCSSAFICN